MSDFPKGGDIVATRAWLDKEGFSGVFTGWKADAILGKSDDFIKSKFPATEEGQERGDILCGLLNTARQPTGQQALTEELLKRFDKQSEEIRKLNEFADRVSTPSRRGSKPMSVDTAGSSSPRMDCVFILMHKTKSSGPVPLGTAWVVDSQSRRLLLTANHCLPVQNSLNDTLFLVEGLSRNADGTIALSSQPIHVHINCACLTSDVAVLQADSAFGKMIPLCPPQDYPVQRKEHQVKSYHYPIQMFTEGQVDAISCESTGYVPMSGTTNHHFHVKGQHTHGSSGGPVVDFLGRACGVLCSGYIPGAKLSINDPFNTLWETVTALSEGHGPCTKAVKLSCVNGLYEYLNTH